MIGEKSLKNLNNLRALRLASKIISPVFLNVENCLLVQFMKYVSNTRLDNNKLVDLNGLVSSLDNLRWLNVSTNNLQVTMMMMMRMMMRMMMLMRMMKRMNLRWLNVSTNNLHVTKVGSILVFASSINQLLSVV